MYSAARRCPTFLRCCVKQVAYNITEILCCGHCVILLNRDIRQSCPLPLNSQGTIFNCLSCVMIEFSCHLRYFCWIPANKKEVAIKCNKMIGVDFHIWRRKSVYLFSELLSWTTSLELSRRWVKHHFRNFKVSSGLKSLSFSLVPDIIEYTNKQTYTPQSYEFSWRGKSLG